MCHPVSSSYQAVCVVLLACTLCLVSLWITAQQANAATTSQNQFDCANVSEIPLAECEALVALYNSTDGPNWANNSGWLQTNTPCTNWFGVATCENDQVVHLNLKENRLSGPLPNAIGNFTNLQFLDLRSNQITGTIPIEIGNLPQLKFLHLFSNTISGPLPESLGSLAQLEVLVFTSNALSGEIPESLGNLTALTQLELQGNRLVGSIPASLGNLSALKRLVLHSNSLIGSIPTELGQLTNLGELHLAKNQLRGEIPSSLGSLSQLEALMLYDNNLTGVIPPELGNLSNLSDLQLADNQLQGEIPTQLENLSNLGSLRLNNNQLNGGIPTWLGDLTNLVTLDLYANPIGGEIPAELGSLTKLSKLGLSGMNLTGTLPSALGVLIELTDLRLSNNHLSGPIPTELCNLTKLKILWLFSNKLNGEIPACLVNLTNLPILPLPEGCDIRFNALKASDPLLRPFLSNRCPGWEETQTVPPTDLQVAAWTDTSVQLTWTPIAYTADGGGYQINIATSPDGPYVEVGVTESKASNSYTVADLIPGTAYYFVVRTLTPYNTNNLQDLFSEYSEEVVAIPMANQLCSTVSEIPSHECQTLVNLHETMQGSNWITKTNWLETTEPCTWYGIRCESGYVSEVILPNNRLDGPIQTTVRVLSNLEHLDLSNNSLTGSVPPELKNLDLLKFLQLHNNLLSGEIPPDLGALPKLQQLWLQENQLSGTIPAELGSLSSLTNLYLNNNQLEGSIPPELGDLSQLQVLRLEFNGLSGPIPPAFGNLEQMYRLWLHVNQLTGTIPVELTNLAKMHELNLAANRLTGDIPSAIGNLTELRILSLNQNQLDGTIPTTVQGLTELTWLSVDDNQLSGSVPSRLGDLSQLLTLRLANNALEGCLPTTLTSLQKLTDFRFDRTNLQEPSDPSFQNWLNRIREEGTYIGTGVNCGPLPPTGYEPNNTCDQANEIANFGAIQSHAFEQAGDVDWVKFSALANTRYRISAKPPITSTADVSIGVFDVCNGNALAEEDGTFSPDAQLEFEAQTTGILYIKLINHDPDVAGTDVRYDLSVRPLQSPVTETNSALILVAGAIKDNDLVQPNIYQVTDQVRQTFINHGYTDDNIQYLTPADADHEGKANVDGESSVAALKSAITTWAAERVNGNGVLNLYLMDHGTKDTLYLDKRRREWVSPAEIDAWLDELEAKHPGIKVNIVIEACYAGSFISTSTTTTDTVSSPGRVVIASTGDNNLAWASEQGGAHFSDRFLAELNLKASLYESFREASVAASAFHPSQQAWLDADGNGTPNQDSDQAVAEQRGFGIAQTLDPGNAAPSIFQVQAPSTVSNNVGELTAEVRDDESIRHVWAVIYSPQYVPPERSEALVRDEDAPEGSIIKIGLTDANGDSIYRVTSNDFEEEGEYRVVFYAEDDQGLVALPKVKTVTRQILGQEDSMHLFLPLVTQ
ncbi:MAG: leucine-rich repeat domain-containing protein [Chloroflexota bacterium]